MQESNQIQSQYNYAPFGGVLSNSGEDERQTFIGNTWSWEFGNGNWIFTPLASRSTHLRWWTPYHYSANNPVSFLDRNGYYYNFSELSMSDKALVNTFHYIYNIVFSNDNVLRRNATSNDLIVVATNNQLPANGYVGDIEFKGKSATLSSSSIQLNFTNGGSFFSKLATYIEENYHVEELRDDPSAVARYIDEENTPYIKRPSENAIHEKAKKDVLIIIDYIGVDAARHIARVYANSQNVALARHLIFMYYYQVHEEIEKNNDEESGTNNENE